jgi:HPt (histidine-containing phosphotransfer) domain-containing protein
MTDPLDSATVEQIRQLGGDKLLTELVEIFLKHTPLRLQELRAGLAEGDTVRAAKAAHSFRSSSISLGARALAEEAASLERLADQGDTSEVRERLPAFESSVDDLLTFLNSEYGSRT